MPKITCERCDVNSSALLQVISLTFFPQKNFLKVYTKLVLYEPLQEQVCQGNTFLLDNSLTSQLEQVQQSGCSNEHNIRCNDMKCDEWDEMKCFHHQHIQHELHNLKVFPTCLPRNCGLSDVLLHIFMHTVFRHAYFPFNFCQIPEVLKFVSVEFTKKSPFHPQWFKKGKIICIRFGRWKCASFSNKISLRKSLTT